VSRRLVAIALALAATLVAGCGGVSSVHPLSDEAATRVDRTLVGFWTPLDVDAKPTPTGARDQTLLAIGLVSPERRVMSLTWITVKADGTVETSAARFTATRIGPRDCASLFLAEEGTSCVPLRYELVGTDALRVYGLDEHVVASDVKAGRVAGGVKEAEAGTAPSAPTVSLTAPTATLRAYLEANDARVWKTAKPLVLRRVPSP
jgi:hypothetical protein